MLTHDKLLLSLSAQRSYAAKLRAIFGSSLINFLPLNDTSGTTAVDPVTGRNWTYGASNVTLGQAGPSSGNPSVLFGGASAGQVTPPAATLTALNTAGVFDPLEGSMGVWFFLSAANMANASAYTAAGIGVDNNNRFNLNKASAGNLQARWAIGGTVIGITTTAYPGGSWAHLLLTWSSSLNKRRGFLNGVQFGNDQTYTGTWSGVLNATWSQLASANNTVYLPGYVALFILANRAATIPEAGALGVITP